MTKIDDKFDAIAAQIDALKKAQEAGATLLPADQQKITTWESLTANAKKLLADGNIEWESEAAPKGFKGMLVDAFDEVAMSASTGYISRSMRERYRQDVKQTVIASFEAKPAAAAKAKPPKAAR
ncbi:MAG: hypothetical protein K0R10_1850 [Alphaproteobacteria bacterium]|jgi:hypothetical protein|nr:hypothetical protein [Alphaproteobacteria bacterium]